LTYFDEEKKNFNFDFTEIKLLIKKFVENIKVIYNDWNYGGGREKVVVNR